MENNTPYPCPVDGLPSPLSTDIDEIASYMRVAHVVATARERKQSAVGRNT